MLLLTLPRVVAAQSWQWVAAPTPTGATSSTITASTRDGAGNLVVAGNFKGTLTLGTLTLTSSTNTSADLFIARISPTGTWLAASSATISAQGTIIPTKLALQANGDVVVAGHFRGVTAKFGATTLTNAAPVNNNSIYITSLDIFVARWSNAGQWTQAVRAGGTKDETVGALALDAAGNVVIGGGFGSQGCQFGTYVLNNIDNTTYASADLFVARLSAAGSWTQAISAGSGGGEYVTGLAVQEDGTINLTGTFNSYMLMLGDVFLYNNGYNNSYYT